MMTKCWLVFIVITSCDLGVETELYPPEWTSICQHEIIITNLTSKHVDLNCTLSGNDQTQMTLKELSIYTHNVTTENTYNIDIKCVNGGNLSMTWPMKINQLKELKITGCDVYDYIKDWNNLELDGTNDNLVILEIINSVAYLDMVFLVESISGIENSSREWDCGHDETLRKHVNRNFSFDFIITDYSIIQDVLGDRIFDFIAALDDLNSNCNFKSLIELEDTYSLTTTKDLFKAMVIDAKYDKLQMMNYSHNGWDSIPQQLLGWYGYFKALKYMDLSYNVITEVSLADYSGPKRGKETIIDVRYNNITVLTIQDLKLWSNLKNTFVDIRGNPLNCGCVKQDFILKIQAEEFFVGDLSKYKYIRNMTCASPESARGVTLARITKVEMGCSLPPADLTVSMIVLGVVAATLILVIVLTFWYRKEIKIMLYIKLNILLPWDVDDKKEDKRYDAFVSYSSGDEDWVYDYLQTHLETPANAETSSFSLCLHQRDFIGGTSILENIINSIENSRHTIVILSKNFLKSVWGMEEFRHAYYQSIVKKHRHLIIIKYENIPEQLMDATLKRCLKTFTYIDIKDHMFLDRLRFALAIKTRPSKVKKVPGNIPQELILPGPLIITDNAVAMNTQVSNSSDDSGCFVTVESGFNGHVNPAVNVDSGFNGHVNLAVNVD